MKYPFRDLKISPGPDRLSIDSTTLIREDRDSEFKKHGRGRDSHPLEIDSTGRGGVAHRCGAILHRRAPEIADHHLVFATHDRTLAKAAAAMHFEVIGA